MKAFALVSVGLCVLATVNIVAFAYMTYGFYSTTMFGA